MTAWSILTVKLDGGELKHDVDPKPPVIFDIDSGIEGTSWFSDELFSAISFGRHQELRFRKMLNKMHSPWYSGVSEAFITTAENTGENASVQYYKPEQRRFEMRKDGYELEGIISGSRYGKEKEKLQQKMLDTFGCVVPIDPPENSIPPDMTVTKTP